MSQTLKSKTVDGLIWSAIDKIVNQGGHFIVNIFFARLLTPNDFGLVAILMILVSFAKVFVDSGMGKALIQKQNRNQEDFSTAFVFSIVLSIFSYVIIYLTAPCVAVFFQEDKLIELIRIISVVIILNSFLIVYRAKVFIDVNFKKLAKINLFSFIISSLIGLLAAIKGYGVYSLLIHTIASSFFTLLGFVFFVKWRPSISFSRESFKKMFGFGSNLLIAGIISQVFQQLYSIVTGKYFSASVLGYYSNAKNYSDLSSSFVASVVQQVSFPVMSKLQDDKEALYTTQRKLIKLTSFIIFPLMMLMIVLAEPLIIILLTEKWRNSIILLKWLCLSRILFPLSILNIGLLNSIGKSGLFLRMDLLKIPIIILMLIITIPLGIEALVIGSTIMSFISFFINTYLPGKIIGYGIIEQIKDISIYLFMSLIMVLIVYIVKLIFDTYLLQLVFGTLTGFVSYLLTSYLFGVEELKVVLKLVKAKIK